MGMFCYQCEQTAKGTGCTVAGVCGKDSETAALQDILLHITTGISKYAHKAREFKASDNKIDVFVIEALFSTVTNVNFDKQRFENLIESAIEIKDKAKNLYESACKNAGKEPEILDPHSESYSKLSLNDWIAQGAQLSIQNRINNKGADITGLQELLTYGLKGLAAYADHAKILGVEDDTVYAFVHEALEFLTNENPTVDELVGFNLKCGEVNLKVMEILDKGNTETYGHPEPTEVKVEPVKGNAILVSGHDLKDLYELLVQTEGKGINIYTHCEMLPAHAYPELKKFKHLAGNYGSAWQNQQKEFDAFPGAILFTTNCLQKPKDSYKSRVFTTGLTGWPGVTHIENYNFAKVIESALNSEGFKEDGEDKKITIGFARNTVMSVAGKVIEAVKSGDIKHFFLIGGCDGAKPGRNYYTDFALAAPKDTVILTLACGKYRFNKHEFGDIGGIPRLLDIGQCNDAYSAVQIAVALANAFDTDVNGLPLSFILSWYEQKAVAILLSLLHLGIKNIRLGPGLPAFVTPAVLNVLVENFNIMPVGSSAEEDIKTILG